MTAVTPPHASGVVDVTVTNENGPDTLVGGFTYNNAPNVTSVSPMNGTPLGGDTVTLLGTDFTPSDQVTFGGLPVVDLTFVDSGTLSAVVPPNVPGPVDVVISNVNGTNTLVGGFIYNNPPTLASISPANGTPLGGDAVTASGADFTVSLVVSVDGMIVPSTFVDSTMVTFVTPPHASGPVDVAVANENGSSTLSGAFTYDPGPQISSVTPNQGDPAGGEVVTVTGAEFTPDAVVTFAGIGASTTFVDAGTLSVTTPAHPGGQVDVTVTNLNGSATLPGGYIYIAVPTIKAVSPSLSPLLGNVLVTLTGTGFTAGDTVVIGTQMASAVTFIDSQTLQLLTPQNAAGVYDITLTSIGGMVTLPQAMTYLGSPTITQVSPSAGDISGSTLVTITGTELSVLGDVAVNFGSNAGSVLDVQGGTMIIVQTPPSALTGPVTVTVITTGGTASVAAGYFYNTDLETFVRADSNGDQDIDIGDAIFTIQHLFVPGSATPTCFDASDANDDAEIDISDIIYTIAFIFQGGVQPPPPFPVCGTDGSGDTIFCLLYAPCDG